MDIYIYIYIYIMITRARTLWFVMGKHGKNFV